MVVIRILRFIISLWLTIVLWPIALVITMFFGFHDVPSPKLMYQGIRDGLTSGCKKIVSFVKSEITS